MPAKANFTQFYLQHALLHTSIHSYFLVVSAGAIFQEAVHQSSPNQDFFQLPASTLDQLAVTRDTPL
eukprot:6646053-Prorocentrum_lima.AAC.1